MGRSGRNDREMARAQRRLKRRLEELDEAERDVAYYTAMLADLEDQRDGVTHPTAADDDTRRDAEARA